MGYSEASFISIYQIVRWVPTRVSSSPPLPPNLAIFSLGCSTQHPGCVASLGKKPGWAVHSQRGQVIVVGRQLLKALGSQCPLSSVPGQLVIYQAPQKSSWFPRRGERLCSRQLIDPMGITLIWCLALVLIKWITSKVGPVSLRVVSTTHDW